MEEEGWDDQSGTNMKLSRAFVVVLILHVVAVGGILAFQAIEKTGNKERVLDAEPVLPPKVEDQPVLAARVVPENLRPIQINRSESTSHLASVYSISEEEILNVNPNLSRGIINPGTVVYLPPSAREPVVDQLPVAPVVEAPDDISVEESQTAQVGQSNLVQPVPRSPDTTTGARPSTVTPEPTTSSGQSTTYTMKPGDNPYRVALKFGITQEALMRANGISDPTKVPAGKVLIIPGQ